MIFVMVMKGVKGKISKMMNNLRTFHKEIYTLVRSPIFVMITMFGNSLIGLCGVIFFYLEKEVNPHLHGFIDAIWWSFSTATTTGNGNIMPVTMAGKILGILLMLMGMALFSMYTGLFAEIILSETRKRH